jgi:hypothetical protein
LVYRRAEFFKAWRHEKVLMCRLENHASKKFRLHTSEDSWQDLELYDSRIKTQLVICEARER